jgi:hypothetical protein
MRLYVITLILFFATALSAAATYRSANLLYVVPISNDTFEVIEDRGAGPSDIWCSAADYARAAGLDGVRKRMYIVEPRGKSKTTPNAIGVTFTTNPSEELKNTPRSYSVSVKRKGENLPIDHAYEFCFDNMFDRLNNF